VARRVTAVALGLLSILFFLWNAEWLLHALVPTKGYLPTLFVSFPVAASLGGIVVAFKASDDARAAGTVYAYAYNSWLAVPVFTLVDRPHILVGVLITLLNIGMTLLGGVIGRKFLPGFENSRWSKGFLRPLDSASEVKSHFGRGVRLIFGALFGCIFLWLSFDRASFWLGVLAVIGYVVARSAFERGGGTETIARSKLFNSGLRYFDKFAFACAIGVIVRSSAATTYTTNTNIVEEAKSGRNSRLDALDSAVKSKLIAQRAEYLAVRDGYLDAQGSMRARGAASVLACADRGNPHCQVMIGVAYRVADGVQRDLDRARHYTWLALREDHHPIAFNNMLVFAHEASPEPYSELLTHTQSPETLDWFRSKGCGR
jgi:hypothetical protein